MEIIEQRSNESLKTAAIRDARNNLILLYSSLCSLKFSEIKYFVKKMFTVFGSTYICEQTISLMKYGKSEYASRLTDGHLNAVLRFFTSKIAFTFVCIYFYNIK